MKPFFLSGRKENGPFMLEPWNANLFQSTFSCRDSDHVPKHSEDFAGKASPSVMNSQQQRRSRTRFSSGHYVIFIF